MTIKSQRADGRGHWPAGKRRNPDTGQWNRTRLRLARLIEDHPRRGRISCRALADAVGVGDRAVRNWIAGIDRPAPELQDAVRQWITERQAELKREKP